MNITEGTIVFMSDGTFGKVLYVYKFEAVCIVETENNGIITIPLQDLTTDKPDETI